VVILFATKYGPVWEKGWKMVAHKTREWKMWDWIIWHQMTWVENMGIENAAPS